MHGVDDRLDRLRGLGGVEADLRGGLLAADADGGAFGGGAGAARPVPETELVPISYTCDRMYAPLTMHGCEMNYFPAPLQHPLQFCGEVPGDDVTDEADGQAAVQGEAQEVRVLLLTAACC